MKPLTANDPETQSADIVAGNIARLACRTRPAGDSQCVFRDSAFADDVAKSNLSAILEQHGLNKVRSL